MGTAPRHRRPGPGPLLGAAGLAVLAVLAVAGAAGATASTGRNPHGVVLRWRAGGGLCRWDAGRGDGQVCRETITRDGRWRRRSTASPARSGRVAPGAVRALTASARRDATALADLPVETGGCASAYDGTDESYPFAVDGRRVTASSCERVLDPSNPLLRAAGAVLAPIRAEAGAGRAGGP